jgi:hypothetical protein
LSEVRDRCCGGCPCLGSVRQCLHRQ